MQEERDKESRVSVRVEPELRAAFYAKAQEEGRTATSVIIDFINQYLGGRTSISELTELRQRVERIEATQRGELMA
ncbi:MAG: hypothetical protein V7K67_02170 [Nostoc sp.]|uniref:hypothetical protein n=1 Tax=Nostoc sp. TaxID=1180 RepID=UPI002FF49FDF